MLLFIREDGWAITMPLIPGWSYITSSVSGLRATSLMMIMLLWLHTSSVAQFYPLMRVLQLLWHCLPFKTAATSAAALKCNIIYCHPYCSTWTRPSQWFNLALDVQESVGEMKEQFLAEKINNPTKRIELFHLFYLFQILHNYNSNNNFWWRWNNKEENPQLQSVILIACPGPFVSPRDSNVPCS